MKIDGKKLAEELRGNLKVRIEKLKEQGIVPKIAIITLGDESSWESYVKQKIKVGDELGINVVLINLEDADEGKLLKTIDEIDSDPKYHGLIVQRPMPSSISKEKVVAAISADKDIDGFRPDSRYGVPVWLGVKRLLEQALGEDFASKKLNFVVIGKGETAGTPTINGLKKLSVNPIVIDSRTENREEILKNADVIISAVGKPEILTPDKIKPGSVVIGIGTHTEESKIRGDYKDSQMEESNLSYTPTPGGVGPVNLASLFDNLVTAAELTVERK